MNRKRKEWPTNWLFWIIYLTILIVASYVIKWTKEAHWPEESAECEELPYELGGKPVCVVWKKENPK